MSIEGRVRKLEVDRKRSVSTEGQEIIDLLKLMPPGCGESMLTDQEREELKVFLAGFIPKSNRGENEHE